MNEDAADPDTVESKSLSQSTVDHANKKNKRGGGKPEGRRLVDDVSTNSAVKQVTM